MDTVGHDAHSLSGVLIPLLLHANDLIIMSATAAGLQRQLDSLQQFCVNLAKTKVVTSGSKATSVKLSCSMAMKWSEQCHTSILGFTLAMAIRPEWSKSMK
jgi:hypothetical protein